MTDNAFVHYWEGKAIHHGAVWWFAGNVILLQAAVVGPGMWSLCGCRWTRGSRGIWRGGLSLCDMWTGHVFGGERGNTVPI